MSFFDIAMQTPVFFT